ncbi:MAG: hypothetical protein QM749_17715 [Aquabacterium sp.]
MQTIGVTSERRIGLLLKQQEATYSKEDDARLQILTERLRKLAPRVTSADIDNLDAMVDEIEHASARLDDIEAKYGL